jgi:murein tripeptide amidase MpaA
MSAIRHLKFDQYLSDQQLTELLHDLAAAYPALTQLSSIGRSHQGREIWALEINNPATGPAHEKPGYYIDANIHAEEICGTSVVIYTAWTLLSQYGSDPLVTRLVDEQVFYLLPRINPDGAEIVQTVPFYEWIGNGRFMPGEEQFGPGLHYADINGDGEILDMRMVDAAGEWKQSAHDPRLLIPRSPDDAGGTYYRLLPEGTLVDWDGGDIPIPRPQDGNLNRNFPSNWVPESQQYGSGAFPASEPEIAALVAYILARPNIAGMQAYHTHSGVILRPWMTEPDTFFKGDDKHIYETIGQIGVEETGYPLISIYEDFTPDKTLKRYGSLMDWTFGSLGIPTFSTELWDVFKAAGIVREDFYPLRGFDEEQQLKLLRWQDDALGGDGFMPWTPFEHPQLGAVEIGGWRRMNTFRNPPAARYLEDMARANCRFTLRHAAAAPKLVVKNGVQVQQLGARTFRVSAVVENSGFLPTSLSAQAEYMRAAAPVVAELHAPEGTRFIAGTPQIALGHLAGRSSRPNTYSRFYDWPAASQHVAWTVELPEGAATLTVSAGCARSGTVRATVQLGDAAGAA